MFCGNCGKQLPDGTGICPSCGYNMAAADQVNTSNAMTPVNQEYNQPVPASSEVPAVNMMPPAEVNYQNQSQQAYNDMGTSGNYQDYGNTGNYSNQNYGNSGSYSNQNYGNTGSYYDGLRAGTPEQSGYGTPGQPGQSGSTPGSGIALALGICSISIGVLFGLGFGVFGALAGIGLGIAGLILSINYNKNYGGGAKGGLVTSIIGLSLSIILFIGCAACGASSQGYGCYGCIGGSCTVANDAQKTYSSIFR